MSNSLLTLCVVGPTFLDFRDFHFRKKCPFLKSQDYLPKVHCYVVIKHCLKITITILIYSLIHIKDPPAPLLTRAIPYRGSQTSLIASLILANAKAFRIIHRRPEGVGGALIAARLGGKIYMIFICII